MAGPPPFQDLGKKAEDLLTKNYTFDLQKFALSILSSNGIAHTAAARVRNDGSFTGGINTVYRRGNTEVDLNFDTKSSLYTTVTVKDFLPCTKASFLFNLSGYSLYEVRPPILTLFVQSLRPSVAFDYSIDLKRTPKFEASATIGSKDLYLGGEFGFDAASFSCYKYNAGIGLNQPDLSVAVLLIEKGKALKASYIHTVNPFTSVAAEMIHKFSTHENYISFGSSHVVDRFTVVKTRCSMDGTVQMLCQREWRPKSLITVSAYYDFKAIRPSPRVGLALTLRP